VQSVERVVAEAEHRTTGEVVADVVTRGVDPDGSLARRERSAGIDVREPMVVVAIVPASLDRCREVISRRPMLGATGLAGPAFGVIELAAAHSDAAACAAVLYVLDRADR